MRDIILGLKESAIITEKNVVDLKNYISKKYSGHDSGKISLIFADGIHKIIDKKINQFDEEDRKVIRNNLVRRAVAKNKFEINAYEVFCEYIVNNDKSENSIDLLVDWINGKQEKPVGREKIVGLVSILERQESSEIDDVLERVFSELDRTSEEKSDGQIIEKYYNDCLGEESGLLINVGDLCVNSDGSVECSEPQHFTEKSAEIQTYIKDYLLRHYKKISIISAVCLCVMLASLNVRKVMTLLEKDAGVVVNSIINEKADKDYGYEAVRLGSELGGEFRYIEIDKMVLKGWLDGKNSILAEEPYFSTILDTAKKYDINPLLMFSITGQEQGFVPRNKIDAAKIANNPFNVYGSWQLYNTDIKDASEIAARTIINLSKGKPEDADTIQWINRKYAEDKNWWIGVSRIYSGLKKDIIQ